MTVDGTRPRVASRLARIVGSPWPRLMFLVVLLASAAVLLATQGTPDVQTLRDRVAATGAWAPLLFVAGYALGTVLLVPGVLLTTAAGALFGVVGGSVVVLVGATLGAVASFLLGRVLGRPAVERLVGGRLQRLDGFLARRGLFAVIGLRLVPVVPFALLNYGSGVTAVRLRDYTVGSAIGMTPGVVAYTALGGSFTDPTSPQFLVAVAGLAMLTVAGAVAARLSRRREGLTEPVGEGTGR
ncbi:TVP38/TMEM64 family protein [Micromonospora sp. HNM0581]|uniref:TVP38/TMEM64 family protein n=1 Tax=Micromonospora sp. HNM0581 TaxID=2716341 RepID=UPI00146B67A9|nr:TVP38/TMEM64 family protein [Micromonospora sp. HNM0581]NLU79848.1 TVP38/TMEM64 family protein [Micromonospora sp. HNM0581]